MTQILTKLVTEDIDNRQYVRLAQPFSFESDVLKEYGLESIVIVPTGFVMDYESVPIVRGTNKRGGTAHDYLCRSDSIPVVTKAIAAEVYREIMEHCYSLEDGNIFSRFSNWLRRWIKWGVVYLAPEYFHKHKVLATYEEMRGD